MDVPEQVRSGSESVACPLCGDQDGEALFDGQDLLHGSPGIFSVVQCHGCALVRTNPRPTPETMHAFYPANTYGPYKGRARGSETGSPPLAWHLHADSMSRLMGPVRSGNLLEIGCASGQMIGALRRRGFVVSGIEPSPDAAAMAREAGLEVQVSSIEDAKAPPNAPLDAVIAFHTIEHMHDPAGALAKIREWAKPGAVLVCAVPNVDSWLMRRYGRYWYDLDLPRHLFHFSPATLSRLLDRNGWEVTEIKGERTINGAFGSWAHWLNAHNRGTLGSIMSRVATMSRWGKLPLLPMSAALGYFNASGRMVCRARAR